MNRIRKNCHQLEAPETTYYSSKFQVMNEPMVSRSGTGFHMCGYRLLTGPLPSSCLSQNDGMILGMVQSWWSCRNRTTTMNVDKGH